MDVLQRCIGHCLNTWHSRMHGQHCTGHRKCKQRAVRGWRFDKFPGSSDFVLGTCIHISLHLHKILRYHKMAILYACNRPSPREMLRWDTDLCPGPGLIDASCLLKAILIAAPWTVLITSLTFFMVLYAIEVPDTADTCQQIYSTLHTHTH